jgi:hypothetical protein
MADGDISLTKNQSGTTGALAEDQLFYVSRGSVEFSTDAGTTWVPFDMRDTVNKVVFSSGLTVLYRNKSRGAAAFRRMPI